MSAISNCFLCKEKGLHSLGEGDKLYEQCINCGYSTTAKFKGHKTSNSEFKKITGEVRKWAKEENGYIWLPSMITLPFAMLYPMEVDNIMKWAIADMVDIPKEEQKDYPIEGGGFYKRRYDTDDAKIFDEFIYAMSELNDRAKDEAADAEE